MPFNMAILVNITASTSGHPTSIFLGIRDGAVARKPMVKIPFLLRGWQWHLSLAFKATIPPISKQFQPLSILRFTAARKYGGINLTPSLHRTIWRTPTRPHFEQPLWREKQIRLCAHTTPLTAFQPVRMTSSSACCATNGDFAGMWFQIAEPSVTSTRGMVTWRLWRKRQPCRLKPERI